ncbi:uncharacterized protein LOC112126942 [Cimex lectularius]|uniref:Uncharacterized protein n=1 Tax=Cimex lectularius TaxID=79782 RepID=A0A8I6SIZ7_CIMLE|nr:uncharacterized protein LOC112126942 [Cimex lectularius]
MRWWWHFKDLSYVMSLTCIIHTRMMGEVLYKRTTVLHHLIMPFPKRNSIMSSFYGMPGSDTKDMALWLFDLLQKNDHVQIKRNSEIINSLLGLPKVLNDAGR